MNEENDYIPPSELTTVNAAASVVGTLVDIWEMWDLDKKHDFMENIFGKIWDEDDPNGQKQAEQIKVAEDMTEWDGEPLVPGFKAAVVQISVGMTSCAFAVQALKAEVDSREGWYYVTQAYRWLGILQGIISGRPMGREETVAKFSLAGSDSRHNENRKMKADVFAWCDKNMSAYRSMDSAAEAIAGKEVPVTFRTVRTWIAAWKKKQSAGTP